MKGHARDLMSPRVARATPETPLRELVERLVGGPFGGLPVVDADDEVIGFVSETDVTSALLRGEGSARAQDVMTTDVVTVDEFATSDEVMRLLEKRALHHLPVVRGGKLVGIIAPHDVLRFFLKHLPPRPIAG